MGKASSAKKVAKAARAGGRTSGVRQRNLLFPGIIIGILVLGSGLIFYARSEYQDGSTNVAPVIGDHWHAAYGVYICDQFVDVAENFDSPRGIHSHGDELIHIHPTSRSAVGENSQMKVFLDESPLLDIDEDSIEVGDESWTTEEDTCEVDGEEVEGEVVLAQWDDVINDSNYSLRTNIRDERFRLDGEGFVFAFLPVGETDDIPEPRSVATLTEVSGGAPEDLGGVGLEDINPDDLPEDMTEEDLEELLGESVPAEGGDAEAEAEGDDAEGEGEEEEQAPVGPVPEDTGDSEG